MTEAWFTMTIRAVESSSLSRCDQRRQSLPPAETDRPDQTQEMDIRRDSWAAKKTSGAGSFQPTSLQWSGWSRQLLLRQGWLQGTNCVMMHDDDYDTDLWCCFYPRRTRKCSISSMLFEEIVVFKGMIKCECEQTKSFLQMCLSIMKDMSH